MVTKQYQVYKCGVCGDMVEVLFPGAGTLVCCDKEMDLKEENTVDAAHEKHIPVFEKTEEGILVKVGSVEHPMTEEHYMQMIEVKAGNKLLRKYLHPGEKPELLIKCCLDNIEYAREYYNLHGLWKGQYNA